MALRRRVILFHRWPTMRHMKMMWHVIFDSIALLQWPHGSQPKIAITKEHFLCIEKPIPLLVRCPLVAAYVPL